MDPRLKDGDVGGGDVGGIPIIGAVCHFNDLHLASLSDELSDGQATNSKPKSLTVAVVTSHFAPFFSKFEWLKLNGSDMPKIKAARGIWKDRPKKKKK